MVGFGALPGGIKTVYVDIFENNSGYSGADVYLNERFVFELSKYVKISSRENADAILQGQISEIKLSTASKKSSTSGYERRITMTVNVGLISRDGKRVLFQRKNLNEDYVFDVSTNNSDFSVPSTALSEVGDKISKKVSLLMMSDF